MFMDSCRFQHTDNDTWLEAFFLGADNGCREALPLMTRLSHNSMLTGVLGPVLVVGVGAREMMPHTDEALLCMDVAMHDIALSDLVAAVRDRYRDAGLTA